MNTYLETDKLQHDAYLLSTCYVNLYFEDPLLQAGHNRILKQITDIQIVLDKTARFMLDADTELELMPDFEEVAFSSGTFNPNIGSLFSKSSNAHPSADGEAGIYQKWFESSYKNKYIDTGFSVHAYDLLASGSAIAYIWDNQKNADPGADLSGKVKASLLSGNAWLNGNAGQARIKNSANGQVGHAYAQAEAYVDKSGILFNAEAGICAVKGEVKSVIRLFGYNWTITGSASAGSLEAGAGFTLRKDEFEVAATLGAVCGFGFKFNVKKE